MNLPLTSHDRIVEVGGATLTERTASLAAALLHVCRHVIPVGGGLSGDRKYLIALSGVPVVATCSGSRYGSGCTIRVELPETANTLEQDAEVEQLLDAVAETVGRLSPPVEQLAFVEEDNLPF